MTQPTKIPTYAIEPGGKYAAQGRPSYAHVFRCGPETMPDGRLKNSLCYQANGKDCDYSRPTLDVAR